jgi:hypothetical protein
MGGSCSSHGGVAVQFGFEPRILITTYAWIWIWPDPVDVVVVVKAGVLNQWY